MAKSPTYRMKSRMIIVLVGMVIFGFCVVLHQLFKLQIIEGPKLQGAALDQQLRSYHIGANRGTIYDSTGKVLAQSATVSTVCIAPAQIKTKEKEDAVVDILTNVLGVDKAFVEKKLARKGSFYEKIKTKVEKPTADRLMEKVLGAGLGGAIFLEEDTQRYYPYGNFASTVLGFTNKENQGAYGLESYYNKTLAGTPGRVVSLRNSRGVTLPMQYEDTNPAQDGNSLVLTIDETIQHYLEKNLETAVIENKVENRAVGIVMDVKTGAILGMSTKPDFDPNDPYRIYDEKTREELAQMEVSLSKDEYDTAVWNAQNKQWRNKAISDPYEPGSVFKIVTLSGALESGTVNENWHIYCAGYLKVADHTQHCWIWGSRRQGHGDQSLVDTVKNSCNPAFITLGQLMGAKLFSEYFANFGLTEPTGVDMPGEATGLYYPASKMGLSELSSAAFGQTFTVTPLQMITAASAAVNGGNLMQPYVVKQIIDPQGNVIQNTEPVVKRQVISKDVSKQVAEMLEKVVTEGSGKQSRIPGYRVGGKTGTSEKIGTVDKDGNPSRKKILSFFGFAPINDPQVACLVMLDEPDLVNEYGSTIAAPVVGSILADVLPYMGIEPQYTEEELENVATQTPNLSSPSLSVHEAEAILRNVGLKCRIVGDGTKVIRQVPGYMEPIPKDGTVVLYTDGEEVETIEVPDVVGMTGAQANKALLNAGLNLAIAGTGIENSQSVAASQEPTAGTVVEKGSVVTVKFIDPNLGG